MFHLAQLNIARMLAPIDDPIMEGFVSKLDELNVLADKSPGFVWRLQGEDGNYATDIRPYPDEMMIVNLSVWETIEDLHHYTYKTAHAALIGQRKQWFETHTRPFMVLWWVPVGHIPSVEEAKERLELLREKGPTAEAFTFKTPFYP